MHRLSMRGVSDPDGEDDGLPAVRLTKDEQKDLIIDEKLIINLLSRLIDTGYASITDDLLS